MDIVRYDGGGQVRVGVRSGAGIRRLPVASLAELLRLPLEDIQALAAEGGPAEDGPTRLLPPADGLTEIWASGVTYSRSSAARQEESADADIYARVYGAERPELFFKSPAWRACGHGEPVGVRPDSAVNVPEPELALVISAHGEIVGVTIGNDVSSRTIEGDNPLYLPQAKVYAGAFALGPAVRPAWELPDLYDLGIEMTISRGAVEVSRGGTSTGAFHRRFDELVGWLRRCLAFPDGAVLSTGTGIVPELDFTLLPGDVVTIGIDSVGTLVNPVVSAEPESFGWLTPDPLRQAP